MSNGAKETMVSYLADVSASPDPSGLPGSNVLQQLVNGADAWALAISAVVNPTTARRVRATCASCDSAGWQQVKINRRRSSASPRCPTC